MWMVLYISTGALPLTANTLPAEPWVSSTQALLPNCRAYKTEETEPLGVLAELAQRDAAATFLLVILNDFVAWVAVDVGKAGDLPVDNRLQANLSGIATAVVAERGDCCTLHAKPFPRHCHGSAGCVLDSALVCFAVFKEGVLRRVNDAQSLVNVEPVPAVGARFPNLLGAIDNRC